MKNILNIYLLFSSIYFGLFLLNIENIINNNVSQFQKRIIYSILFIITIYLLYENNNVKLEKIKERMSDKIMNTVIPLDISDNNVSKIIYWVTFNNSESNKSIVGSFENSGIVDVNNNKAIININCSNKYDDGVSRFVHYRTIDNKNMLSDVIVDTIDILSKCY